MKKIWRYGRRVGAALMGGALALSLVPGVALAHYDYDNASGMVTFDKDFNPQGREVTLLSADESSNTYTYRGYAHSDNGSHYKGYSVITTLTTNDDGVLTAVDFTSDNTTFAGMWGYARGKGGASIDGYLPDGVTFNVIENADGTYTPDLSDPKYGMTLTSVTLISTNDDGTKDATGVYANETYNTNTKEEGASAIEVAYTGDKTKIALPEEVVYSKLVRNEDGTVQTKQSGRSVVAVTEEAVAEGSAYNLIRFTYQTAAEKMPFDCYYCIDNDYLSAAEIYCDEVVGDEDGKTVYTNNYSSTNRDGWTAIMGTILLRQFASWGATLADETLSTDLDGELGFIDTVSGATKTSEPVVGAVAAAYEAGYITGVSENVKITIDQSTGMDPIDINANPQDKSSVTKNDDGNYVLNVSFQQYGGGRLTLNKIFLFDLSDMSLGTQGIMTLSKSFDVFDDAKRAENPFEESIVATYAPSIRFGTTTAVTGGDENCTYAFSPSETGVPLETSGNGELTILNQDVTHVVVNYTLGHGEIALVFDLAEMEKIPALTELLEAASSEDPESVAAARAAYDETPYDVRPFADGIDNLEQAEAELVEAMIDELGDDPTLEDVWAAQDALEALDAAAQARVSDDALAALDEAAKSLRFDDVQDESKYYYDSVYAARKLGLMTGIGGTNDFGVGRNLTRAELAVIMWRASNPEEAAAYVAEGTANTTGMKDVADGKWYTAAANWAVENQIINGSLQKDGTRKFDPNGAVTLEMLVAVIGNAHADDVAAADVNALAKYPDASKVSGWAQQSIAWGVSEGIIGNGSKLDSKGKISRERCAVVIINAIDAKLMTVS